MLKKHHILLGLIAVASTNLAWASDHNTVNVNNASIITNLTASADVTIQQSDIATAIATDSPYVFTIAAGCAFTNHADGDFNLTATASGNHVEDADFAGYDSAIDAKLPYTLLVSSTLGGTKQLPLATATHLTDHADPNSTDQLASCSNNTLTFTGSVPLDTLRVTKPGTYQINFSVAASEYDGGGQGQLE